MGVHDVCPMNTCTHMCWDTHRHIWDNCLCVCWGCAQVRYVCRVGRSVGRSMATDQVNNMINWCLSNAMRCARTCCVLRSNAGSLDVLGGSRTAQANWQHIPNTFRTWSMCGVHILLLHTHTHVHTPPTQMCVFVHINWRSANQDSHSRHRERERERVPFRLAVCSISGRRTNATAGRARWTGVFPHRGSSSVMHYEHVSAVGGWDGSAYLCGWAGLCTLKWCDKRGRCGAGAYIVFCGC